MHFLKHSPETLCRTPLSWHFSGQNRCLSTPTDTKKEIASNKTRHQVGKTRHVPACQSELRFEHIIKSVKWVLWGFTILVTRFHVQHNIYQRHRATSAMCDRDCHHGPQERRDFVDKSLENKKCAIENGWRSAISSCGFFKPETQTVLLQEFW